MPNTTVPAAGEAMPAMNRRSLLRGLAVASIAAGGASVASASTLVPVPAENEELIRLGNELPVIVAAFTASRASLKSITAEWTPRWPVAPDEILTSRCVGGELERSLNGYAVERELDGEKVVFGLLTTKALDWHIKFARRVLKGKTVDGRKIRGRTRSELEIDLAEDVANYSLAERYEMECQRIRDLSGYEAAYARFRKVAKDLAAIISSIMAQPAHTMAGIVIKAQALSLSGEGCVIFEDFSASMNWAAQFSTAVLKIAAGNGHMTKSGRV